MKITTYRITLEIDVKHDSADRTVPVVRRSVKGTIQPGGEARQLLAASRALLADVRRGRRKAGRPKG